MSLDLRGLLLLLPLRALWLDDALVLVDLLGLAPTPPRLRGLNSFRPAIPPEEEREPDAPDRDPLAPPSTSLPWTLLFSLWKPRGERIMGERTLDRLLLPPFFFFVDDGGGEAARCRLMDLLATAEEEDDAPGRLGMENGEGAGPSAGALLRLPVAAVLAVRNFIVRSTFGGKNGEEAEEQKKRFLAVGFRVCHKIDFD